LALSYIWLLMAAAAFAAGIINGNMDAVSAAALEGAAKAVETGIGLAGVLCLWTGVMELMRRCGWLDRLSHLMLPVLGGLFKESRGDAAAMYALAANMSANFLGLANAATPTGIAAARRMATLGAENDLVMLVVVNTASIQLIPTTVAALRAASGAVNPFDILPAVWLTSALSVTAGIIAAKGFEKLCSGRM
jgi:spore maturation protein A